jgi:hypothetical protein
VEVKIMEVKPAKVTTTIKHKETGEIYKTEEEWKAKGIHPKRCPCPDAGA